MEMKGKGAGAQGYPPRGLEQRPNSMESARPTKTRNSRKTDVHYRFLLTAKNGSRPAREACAWAATRPLDIRDPLPCHVRRLLPDRKSTRLNSSHRCISYAVL